MKELLLNLKKETRPAIHIYANLRELAFSCSAWSSGKHGDCYFPEITGPIPIICTCAKVSITSKSASAIK